MRATSRSAAPAERTEDRAAAPAAETAGGLAGLLLRVQSSAGNAAAVRLMRSGAPAEMPDDVAGLIGRRIGGGDALSPELRDRHEDADLAGVRVHRDAESAGLARAVGARAFTVGQDIFFGAGEYRPHTGDGSRLLVHELVHTTQSPSVTSGLTVSEPGDVHEIEAARRAESGTVAGGRARTATISREPDQTEGNAAEQAIPEGYRSLLKPSLNEADTAKLAQVTGGADVVAMIRRRDDARVRISRIEADGDTQDPDVGGPHQEYQALVDLERDLTQRIEHDCVSLDVASEAEMLAMAEQWFPARFLAEAKQVALDMLQHNADEAKAELERYSVQVCSPDIEGLLAADQALDQLAPFGLANSVRMAEEALSKYAPPAGVLTPEEFARNIPPNEQSVMVDIANLDQNRRMLAAKTPIYQAARFSYGRTYPILLSSGYVPGSFAMADPTELGKVAAGPVTEVLENIERVQKAINDDELKVWNMRDVLRITQERLNVRHPVLLGAIDAKIAEIKSDETFLGWVRAALAITTTILAGMLFTPAAGAAVAGLWGAGALYGSIRDYLNEEAAENIALDASVADLSLNEPSLTWVLLDAAFLLIDMATVAKSLRAAARTLASQADATAAAAFRREATEALGEQAGEQLATRAAARFGIAEAAVAAGEAGLSRARTALAGLELSDDAIARVLAKARVGPVADRVNKVKGQLLEELAHVDVRRQLAAGASDVLGVGDNAGLELIEGHRIADLSRRQLTDGVIARRLPDGSIEIVTVLESKAGASAAEGLRTASSGVGRRDEFARVVIAEDAEAVEALLRRGGLKTDADAVAAGSSKVSRRAQKVIAEDKGMRDMVTQSEWGGQIRKDVERLSPDTVPGETELSSTLDEVPAEILVDGVPTRVRFSPTRARFVGVVPEDVPVAEITASLTPEFNFAMMQTGGTAADLTARAERLVSEAATP